MYPHPYHLYAQHLERTERLLHQAQAQRRPNKTIRRPQLWLALLTFIRF
jgi:hypothetical protein